MLRKAGITPLVRLARTFVMWAINFQNAPFTLMLDEKINLTSLAMGFSFKSNFGICEKQYAFVIERFSDFDFAMGTESKAMPRDGTVFGLRIRLTFFVGFWHRR